MLDVLVALLLLALTLTGACAMLIQTMRVTHGALLATRAADLAADLTEELLGATSRAEADAVLAAWRARIATELPPATDEKELASIALVSGGAEATQPPPHHLELTLRWRDAGGGGGRQLSLPVAIDLEYRPH